MGDYPKDETMDQKTIETSSYYQKFFDNADDAIIVWQVDEQYSFKIINANQAACTRYGYTLAEIIDLNASKLNTSESLANSRSVIPALFKDGHVTSEITHVTKQGKPIPTEVKAHFISLNGQQVVVSVCRDISERKELECRHQELLEREHKLLTELQASINMRTNYINALVHELKTPLTSLMVSSEHLMDTLKEGPLYGFAKNISFGAESINHRINELHDVIRLEAGTLELATYPVDIQELIHEVSNFVIPLAQRGDVSFDVQIPDFLPKVCGDKERLQQVLLNLLNNALKYTPKKGYVWLKATVYPKELVIEVQDTGCGISERSQEDLFKSYSHRDPVRQKTDGLGLGLVISKAIIERYKGRIWVSSQPGEGSRFFIALPIMAKEGNCESTSNR